LILVAKLFVLLAPKDRFSIFFNLFTQVITETRRSHLVTFVYI